MALCKYCGKVFQWGNADGRWVPLIPVGEEGDLDRKYQDENGVLRAGHRDICTFVTAVKVSKLAKPISADDVLPSGRFTIKRKRKRSYDDEQPQSGGTAAGTEGTGEGVS